MNPGVFDDVLTAQAAATPEAEAVVDASTRLTYRQLDERVGAAGAILAGAGLRSGERAVLVADNSVHHLVTAFAIWRLDATLVTIYPSSTVDELSYAIDAAPTVYNTTTGATSWPGKARAAVRVRRGVRR